MKRLIAMLAGLCLLLQAAAFTEGSVIPGTYTGTGKGFGDKIPVTVTVTVDENGVITGASISGDEEIPFGQMNFDAYAAALAGRTDGEIDALTGATETRNGVAEAVADALRQAVAASGAEPAISIPALKALTAGILAIVNRVER